MLTKTSLFDFRYFRYSLKRMLPYSLVILLVLILSSFLVFGITDIVSTLLIGNIRYIGVELLGITANVGMYIIPVALAVGMFGFLHKKNYADFILASPVKRPSVFFTNLVAGFAIISVMLIVNLLFIAIVISAGENYLSYVALNDYFLSFFYNLAGYMLVFAVSSFAAVLTGTALSQVYMTYIILFLPAFLAAFLQLPFLIQSTSKFIEVEYTIPLNNILLIPNIPAMPLTMAALGINGPVYTDFYGINYFFSAKAICYTLLIAIKYTVLGIIVFKKFKAENAGKSFVNKGVGVFAYAASFGPVMLICFLAFAQDSFYYMIDSPLFYIFIVLSFIAFIIASLVFNKGFAGFGKQLTLYLILIVSTAIFSGVLNVIAEHSVKTVDFRKEDLKSVSVYMQPINAKPIYEPNISENYVKVKIDDPQILSLLAKGSSSAGDRYYCEIERPGHGKITLCILLPDEFVNALYEYIDENAEVKKSLLFLPGAKNIACTSLNIETAYEYMSYSSSFEKKEEAERIIAEREIEYLDIPIEKLYKNADFKNRFSYQYQYESQPLNFGLINYDSVNFSLTALRNYRGQYFVSNYVIDYDSAFFYGVAKESHERADNVIPLIDNTSKVAIAGAFNLDREQYMLLEEIIPSLPSVMTSDFRAAIQQTVKEPIETTNTVAISIETERENALVFLNIERDLKPLMDIYLDRVIGAFEKHLKDIANSGSGPATSEYYFNGGYYQRSGVAAVSTGAMFDGEICELSAFFDIGAYNLTFEELTELISENKDYINGILTAKYTKETLGDEYYFLSVITDLNDWYGELTPAIIPVSKQMLMKISDAYGYLDTNSTHFEAENLEKVEYDSTNISTADKADWEYLVLLLKDSYFRVAEGSLYNNAGGYLYYSGYNRPSFEIMYETADVSFFYKDGSNESAEILLTKRASDIIKKESGGE